MAQLGANAHGEILEPGRVPDCYLGLRLDPPGHTEPAGVLVVAPAALLHPHVPQGSVKVAVCTQCPSMPAAGTYLPTWINAAMWRWLVMWASDE
jgi:hypothetical protein